MSVVGLGFLSLIGLIHWEKHPLLFLPIGIIFGGLCLYKFVETIIEHYKQNKNL